MSQLRPNLHLYLSDEEARRLADAPERGLHSRSWLARQILRGWLNDPRRSLPADPIMPSLSGALSEAQRAIAIRREKILKRWTAARIAGSRRGQHGNEITEAFLVELRWELSRSTLFRWDRQYRTLGIAGLVDGRSCSNRPVEKCRDTRGNRRRHKPAA